MPWIILIAIIAPILASLISWRLKWAALIATEKLPAAVRGNHNDWWPFLRWVPRRLSAFIPRNWKPPQKLLGNNPAGAHHDIVPRGNWVICWPLFVSITLPNGWHGHAGIRADYEDFYYTIDAALRKY